MAKNEKWRIVLAIVLWLAVVAIVLYLGITAILFPGGM
jgi:hypothetical protein